MDGSGDLARGTVIVRDGRIAAVGPDVAIPSGATVIDARGKIVTPGLVASGTALGLIEVRAVGATDDRATSATDVRAEFDAGYGLTPDSMLLPVARPVGLTRAILPPAHRA